MHRCIGEWLARPVTAVAIAALLDRCPTARIGEVGPWAADPYFRSLTKLQLLLR
jgi:cytochrome P450